MSCDNSRDGHCNTVYLIFIYFILLIDGIGS